MSVKSDAAYFLEQNRGKTVSGQELAEKLGVTRAAVSKAVKALRNEGYKISAAPNKGYILERESDVLSEEGIRLLLPDKHKALPLNVYKSIDSTNNEAKRSAMLGAPHGTVFAADCQTNGRGRHGHAFYSPAQTGLYLSVVLRPEKPLCDCGMITFAAADAVADTIEALTDCEPDIKWVNDILVGGRKVCGILTEAISDIESGMAEAVIVGVGLNVSTADFPPELARTAGSLKCRATRNSLAAGIISRIMDYTQSADSRTLLDSYRSRCALLGETVSYSRNGETITALASGIDNDGSLIVQTSHGTEKLRSGEISIVGDNIYG
ncbi:MAG: biotin--[acetyl-CoA-carboxylase] ligase [Oscillospiraceae bacterium]